MAEIIFWLSLCLILYTSVGYYFLLWLLFKLRARVQTNNSASLPTVSLLISAFNEENVIAEKIANCGKLDYPTDKIEILIGLDGSTDATESVLRENSTGTIKIHIFKDRRGKAAVLNDLVKSAKGDILVFSDANTIYDASAIKNLVRHFAEARIGGVCGRLVLEESRVRDIGSRGERYYWSYESKLKYLEGKVKTVLGANGAIYAIRKALYTYLPENKIIVDDFLIPLKVVEKGYDIVYDAEAIGKEYTSVSIWQEFKRKVRIGAANFNSLSEISTLLSPSKGFVAFGLWSHKVIRWLIPFLGIGLFASNLFLLAEPVYFILFGLQIIVLCGVVIGGILNRLGIYHNLFGYIFYLFMINLAMLIGFFRFITGTQRPAWSRVTR